MYEVTAGKRVRKAMARFPRQDQDRILEKLRSLAEDPRPRGCRKGKTAEPGTYRGRVGDYRIIYVVFDDEDVVIVAHVTRRSEDTYKGL